MSNGKVCVDELDPFDSNLFRCDPVDSEFRTADYGHPQQQQWKQT